MTKVDYLNQLRNALQSINETERKEILQDQEEYIQDAIRSGRKEEDVVLALGSVNDFVKELTINTQIASAASEKNIFSQFKKILKAILMIGVLAPFNLIFILGPFCGLVGVLVAIGAVATAVIICAIVALFVSFIFLGHFPLFLTVLFGSLGLLSASVLIAYGFYFLTKWCFQISIKYIEWNLKLITGDK